MSKISYEFEGHNLVDWAEFGGLPVWYDDYAMKHTKTLDRLVAVSEEWYHLLSGNCLRIKAENLKLRYTKLEDIIDEAPWWASHFDVSSQVGYFYDAEGIFPEPHDIEGHLFEEPEEPVNLEQFRKEMKG